MRCGQEQLQAWLREGYHIQAALVSDRYRDLGLVGGIVLSPDRVTLELFCLSCRAMGRRLEQELLAALPPETVRLRWADTGKNAWLYELMLRERRWEAVKREIWDHEFRTLAGAGGRRCILT